MLPLSGRSTAIFIVTTVFMGISFIAVCLRCFVRLRLVKAFGWDDALMVFAMVIRRDLCMVGAVANGSLGLECIVRPVRDHGRLVWHRPEVIPSCAARHYGNCHVCMSALHAARGPRAELTIRTVVVARTNQLCLGMRRREDLHCHGTAPIDCLSSPPVDCMGGDRRDIDYRPGLLVHVNPAMPACLVLLAAGPTVNGPHRQRTRQLYESR